MTEIAFFFDSYAIIEIIKGNTAYNKYRNATIITTKLNLFEVYQALLELAGKEMADHFLEESYPFRIGFDKEIIREAAAMRLKYKKRNISMADCVGYILAKEYRVKFLTGDKEFEDFDPVEFVK